MRKLVFFVGGSGAGKTTLAKKLVARSRAVFLDMDTLQRPAAEALMTAAGFDPTDRDSTDYKRLCRDLGYRITMDAALENVSLGTDVYVVGPFTREIADPGWLERELAQIGTVLNEVDVKAVNVYLQNDALHRARIVGRGSELDRWKLDHWESFSYSLTRMRIEWPLPTDSILYFDNSEKLTEERVKRVEQFLQRY
jgi:adenylate kinase family enzyme